MMWIDTTLAGLMSGVQSMVGTERFGLALQSEGRKSVEADWQVISQFSDFREGFEAIANIAAVAGWGDWKLVSLGEKEKTCRFRVWNSWEGRYQKALNVCWGSGMLAGKMAGYCSKLFETNCWTEQTTFIALGDEHDEFVVQPSERSIENELENLLTTDEATRADMAVALQKLRIEVAERKRAEEALEESHERLLTILDGIDADIYVADMETYAILFVNRHMRASFGEGLVGDICWEVFRGELGPCNHCTNDQLLDVDGNPAGLVVWEGQNPITGNWYMNYDRAIRWVDGRLVRLQVATDITERKEAEAQVRAEKEFTDTALDAQLDTFFLFEPATGKALRWNRAFRDISGYTDEEIAAQTAPASYYSPEDLERAETFVQKVLKEGTGTIELELICKDGCKVLTEYRVSAIMDDSGEPRYFISIGRDITERKRAEQAMWESERKYRSLVENSTDGIAIVQGNKIRFVNQALLMAFGCQSEDEMVDHAFTSFVSPKHRNLMVERGQEREEGEDVPSRYEFKALRKDGTEFDAELSVSTIVYQGSVARQGIIRDITERKRAEEERARLTAQVREQARRVEQILASVPEGVLLLDAGGRILQANPAAEKDLVVLAGAKVGDVLTQLGGRPLAELLTPPPTPGLWHEVETDGHTFEIIARPMETGPEPEHWVLVINDATREREIRAQLEGQERLAAVGQLAAGVAHDFNNIMSTIVLYAHIVARSETLSGGDRERMATINQQAHHATRLIQQILDFSRRAVLERCPLDLLPLLKEQAKLLERTLPEHIGIELDYGRDEYTVHADPTRMQQAITNLAVNARDAMPQGGTLRIGVERMTVRSDVEPPLPEMEAGDWIALTVTDTGTGIAPDVLPRIFDPFFTTKESGEGSGLGLAQVHGIVGQHGGCIGVETRTGEGTTFTIYLPALEVRPAELPLPDFSAVPQGQGEVVLVVEDGEAVRAALVTSLEQLNYQALEAANGEEALAVMEEQGKRIALVLSDVVMPVMGGIALLHALREKDWQTPVVLLTGHPMDNKLDGLEAQGLSAWLPKPPSLERLAQAVAKALRDLPHQK
jgi:PAS domain S-box-containing protein